MKKYFAIIAIALFALVSCAPQPELSVDQTSIQVSNEGGSFTVMLKCNVQWTATSSNSAITVSPSSGVEDCFVTISVPATKEENGVSGTVTFSAVNKTGSASKTVSVSQSGAPGQIHITKTEINGESSEPVIPAEGCELKVYFTSNFGWTMTVEPSDLVADKTSGAAGDNVVTIKVPACPDFEGRQVSVTVDCKGNNERMGFSQSGGVIVYAGEVYHAVKMKDGKWWMAENLRYLPEGMTPSAELGNVLAGLWYPVVVNAEHTAADFSTSEAAIKSNGYLYSTEVAFGLKPGALTSQAEAEKYEGARGICPEGWHIPTVADMQGLTGKCNGMADVTTAPYFDGKNGSMSLLDEDGFNAAAWGAVSIASTAAAKGTMTGWLKAYPDIIASGFMVGSTHYKTTLNDDGSIKNIQFFGFMPMASTGTFNGAYNNFRTGASLRCVKDQN